MRRSATALFGRRAGCAAIFVLSAVLAIAGALCPRDLADYVDDMTSIGLTARSTWAIRIEELGDRHALFGLNDHRVFTVASNTKLLTYATVLSNMNISDPLQTRLYASAPAKSGELEQLCVQAVGDPSVTTASLAAAVASIRNVASINSLSVYQSLFTLATIAPPTWEVSDLLATYGSMINSAMVNENNVVFTVITNGSQLSVSYQNAADVNTMPVDLSGVSVVAGAEPNLSGVFMQGSPTLFVSGTMPPNAVSLQTGFCGLNPNQRFLDELTAAFAAANIPVASSSLSTSPCACAVSPSTPGCELLATITSAPIVDLVNYALLVSDNTYTESFLRQLGVLSAFGGDVSEAGLAYVAQFLTGELGVPVSSFTQIDGSGVSRENLISTEALAAILQGMAVKPLTLANGTVITLQSLLPVGGVSGSLAERFVGTIGEGRVFAKTGTLNNVNALSGYINRTGLVPSTPLVFSIVNTGSMLNGTAGREQIDALVLQLFDLQSSCPERHRATPSRGISTGAAVALAFGAAAFGALVALVVMFVIFAIRRRSGGYRTIQQ
eukprot:c40344_g1_i1.p1 GENE.c40344_g1_i1~~c40344_g1_i1.p1  ORF type:complete len:554 (+),score=87.30 c40344_g1_i1:88-1749(+)